MSLEGHGVTDAHTTRGLEDLSISILATHTDDFAHEGSIANGDVANLILSNGSVGLDGDEVGDDTFYTTFCCHV